MPRYFFNYLDGVEHLDKQGVEVSGIDQARALAVASSGEAIKELGPKFWEHPEWETWVTDGSGSTVCSVQFLGKTEARPKPWPLSQ